MKISLNYSWSFIEGFDESYIRSTPRSALKIDVPHTVKMLPTHYFDEKDYQGIYTYVKEFDAPSAKHCFLNFDGAMLQMDIFLNGESLGHFISGYMPVKIEVTSLLKKRGNRLVVRLDTHEDENIPPFGNIVDYLTYGGIYRSVYLETHGEEFIEDLFIQAKADGTLIIKPTLHGKGSVSYHLYDGEILVSSFGNDETKIDNVKLWSPENPNLYTLISTFGGEDREDVVGFRDVSFKENGFFLNGRKYKLLGTNRHQAFPYFGYAAPHALQKEDAFILKNQIGINTVRTSHYPDDESFLDECDRLGLFVLDEIPGWQHISKDPKWREECVSNARRMILKERNHPCLIAYGLRIDESADDHELYSAIEQVKNELDPDRQSLGVRNFKDSECLEDVYAYNDFSCKDINHGLDDIATWKGAKGKPKLVTENNGHVFPTKPWDNVERKIEQALRHARVIDDAYKQEDLCGMTSWCAFDYGTHASFGGGDHVCYHGVADMFRNNKYAAYVYRSQVVPNSFFVASNLRNGDFPDSILPSTYVFTDADYVKVIFDNEEIGDFYPDKKHYPHMPHPPVLVDDWIGKRWNEPSISEKDAKKIIDALNDVNHVGLAKIGLKTKADIAFICLKYHMDMAKMTDLFNKYELPVDISPRPLHFVGYKDGKEFARSTFGLFGKTKLTTRLFKETLSNGFDYDCTSLTVSATDPFGNVVPYGNEIISIVTEGQIEVMGPTTIALEGGSTRIYIRSTAPIGKKGNAKVIIKGQSETIEIALRLE